MVVFATGHGGYFGFRIPISNDDEPEPAQLAADAPAMMNFRRATLADVPATMAVRMAVRENILENPERVPLSLVESHIEERGAGWVCEDAGEIIGFSFADQTNHSIFGLFIHPDHEGRGIGKHIADRQRFGYQKLRELRLLVGPQTHRQLKEFS